MANEMIKPALLVAATKKGDGEAWATLATRMYKVKLTCYIDRYAGYSKATDTASTRAWVYVVARLSSS